MGARGTAADHRYHGGFRRMEAIERHWSYIVTSARMELIDIALLDLLHNELPLPLSSFSQSWVYFQTP
jgi:hypothetical protein